MSEQHTEAHRPHVTQRRRLIPLGALVLCVLLAAMAGAVHGGAVSAGAPPKKGLDLLHAQSKLAKQAINRAARADGKGAARASSVCTPKFKATHKDEPWVGAEKKSSEAAFRRAIAKENRNYVKGKKGWLFFSDLFNKNFSQAVGRETQSKKNEKAWANYIKSLQAQAAAAGADFRMVIAPANWDIYPQRLPAWAQKLRGGTSLEHLLKDYPKLPWIDTRAALAKASKADATYEPLDSHWTRYGGWVAWRAITACLRTNPALASVSEPPVSGVGIGANSNEFSVYGVPDGKPANTYPIFVSPHPDYTITHIPDGAPVTTYPDGSVDQIYSPAQTVTPGAISPLSLLVLRDSTGNALSPLWNWTFAKTWSYRHLVDAKQTPNVGQLVQTYHPNVVLFVMTERFLYYPPPKQ